MFSASKKPFSAISVHVENLTSETYEEDDLAGVPDLLEVVRLQATGPSEVARALRKKLKYGSVHRQLRALTILDGILQNGGTRLQRTILADAPLLERLRIAGADPLSDEDVRNKCRALFGQWVASTKEQPGLEGAKALYNTLPKKQKTVQQRREQSKVLRETEQEAEAEEEDDFSPPIVAPRKSSHVTPEPSTLKKQSNPIALGPSSTFSSFKLKKDKKAKGTKLFNIEKERPAILQSIAASSVASTNLSNALKLVNRESRRVSDDPEVAKRFETCKQLRRQILRYIQNIETDEFLGGLIHANEELITALMAFEIMDKSVEDDSDSELEEAQHLSRQAARSEISAQKDAQKTMAGLSIEPTPPKQPPRPAKMVMPIRPKYPQKKEESEDEDEEDEDSDDPFGDKNVVKTPALETANRTGYSFREV